jgi:hypothetical protein
VTVTIARARKLECITMRGIASTLILSILALAVAGCAGGSGGDPNAAPYGGYYGPAYYGQGYNVEPSACGALGTCPASNAIRLTPYDMHSGE